MNVMRQRDFGRNTGLQTRMAITVFLLGLVYAVLIAVAVTAGVGIVGVVALFAVLCGVQLFAAEIALRATGARAISPGELPELQAMIDRLCVQANIPRPRVAIVNTPMPNAFALGRSQKTATVCVTTELLSALSPEQLEGVIAHELTHIVNRDVMVMTVASFFASVSALLVRYGLLFGRRGRDGQTQLAVGAVVLVSVAVYVVSFILLRALSRYREYAADRGAAILTGRPSALASALLTLNDRIGTIPTKDLRTVAQMNAFFIIPARQKAWLMSVFATHPPVEKRVAALASYEEQLQGAEPQPHHRRRTRRAAPARSTRRRVRPRGSPSARRRGSPAPPPLAAAHR